MSPVTIAGIRQGPPPGSDAETWLHYAQVKDKRHSRVKTADILEFFQQLAILLRSGTPLIEALQIGSRQTESLQLATLLEKVAQEVSGGRGLSDSLARHRKIFDSRITSLVEVGEASGDLPGAIVRLRNVLKKSSATSNKIVSAMIYPAVLVCISTLCIMVMMWKVIPEFSALFADKGGKLPSITIFVMGFSDWVQTYGGHALVGVLVVASALWKVYQTERGRRVFNILFVVTPIVGNLFVQLSMLRFATNLSLLLRSGMPLLDSLWTCGKIFDDTPIYRRAMLFAHSALSGGTSLHQSLEETQLFTPMVLNLVRVGEESGRLPEVLDVISEYYEEKVEILVERVTGLMEPVIIVVMGVIMASIMAAIYIPMFDLSSGGAQ